MSHPSQPVSLLYLFSNAAVASSEDDSGRARENVLDDDAVAKADRIEGPREAHADVREGLTRNPT